MIFCVLHTTAGVGKVELPTLTLPILLVITHSAVPQAELHHLPLRLVLSSEPTSHLAGSSQGCLKLY